MCFQVKCKKDKNQLLVLKYWVRFLFLPPIIIISLCILFYGANSTMTHCCNLSLFIAVKRNISWKKGSYSIILHLSELRLPGSLAHLKQHLKCPSLSISFLPHLDVPVINYNLFMLDSKKYFRKLSIFKQRKIGTFFTVFNGIEAMVIDVLEIWEGRSTWIDKMGMQWGNRW